MRVIAGQCKGRVLFSPKNNLIRPTSDRVKEYLFDRIGDRIEQLLVLDLFAGTGNLSIEALSRGAKSVTLVDKSNDALRLIYQNLELTNYLLRCQVVHSDVLRFLNFAAKTNRKFGLIFADPPYSDSVYQTVMQKIDSINILEKGGLFIFEHDSKVNAELGLKTLEVESRKKLGDTAITFYFKREA